MHNVQELDLCVFVEDPFVLPRSMFCSQTLTSLKLEINCVLEIPDIICFPRLKTLYLSLIIFPDNDSTQRLLTGCRALEELVILDCEWILKDLTISSLTLERLTIDDLPYFGPPDSDSGCKIKIYTPKLLYLNYRGYPLNEIFLCDVSSLVETYISVPVPHAKQKEVASHVVDLLKGVRKVVSLTVADNTIESLVFADDLLTHLPVFKNLTHLELSVEIGNSTIGPLMKLLNCCPNLQSLHFAEGFEHDVCLVDNDLIWSSLPKCLKALIFKKFRGDDSEICFLKCILQHAHVIDKMKIYFCDDLALDAVRKKQVLNAFPFPWLTSTLSLAAGSLIMLVSWGVKVAEAPNTDLDFWKSLFPVALAHTIGHVAATVSMSKVAVSFTHIIKSGEPAFSVLVSRFILGETFPMPVYLSLIPIIGGCGLAALTELNFNMTGFMGAMISNLAFVFRNIFSKRGMKGKSVSGMNYYACLSILSLLILTPFAIAVEGPQVWAVGWQKAITEIGPHFIWWVAAQSIFYHLYNQVSYMSLDEISPLTFSIGNTMKRISVIVSSIIIFRTPVQPVNALGAAIAVFGTFLYSQAKQ
ncbi:triose phosphate/phosphoenolpyruvate translocator [Artemisia annua]|uniref:Triose phosphate/phosphoenolpyruvate translocator n=1 Tax=Artemisia annua TaxID=35608 RepID=A0A2U1MZU1_ARTAN|nr:triose phosphate/phosphoenolpyruvate translocator [Artemisia annua]